MTHKASGKWNIAIAEDQEIFRRALTCLVNKYPEFKVVTSAPNGSLMLKKLRESNEHVHVLITDYKMPEMGGIELCAQTKMRFPEIKVLFLSMFDDESFVCLAASKGADGYLSKDDDLELLEDALKSILSDKKFFPRNYPANYLDEWFDE